jgi:hypothetical protein
MLFLDEEIFSIACFGGTAGKSIWFSISVISLPSRAKDFK